MKRTLLIGTNPNEKNGYSRVMNNIIKFMSKTNEVIVYGFNNANNFTNNEINFNNVQIYSFPDFAIDKIKDFTKLCKPDEILIYNDPYVVTSFIQEIVQCYSDTFCPEIKVYLDIVYPEIKTKYLQILGIYVSKIYVFAECWVSSIKDINVPVTVVFHGIDNSVQYMDKHEARKQLKIFTECPLMLNLNKNIPRKRYDLMLKGLNIYYENCPESELKIIIGTSKNNGAWDLEEIIDMFYPHLKDKIIFISEPHTLDNQTINLLYNACEIGINVADGEGFGLCNYEHASVGGKQILSDLSIFREIHDESAYYVDIACEYYSDNFRDSIGGMGKLISCQSLATQIKNCVENLNEKSTFYAKYCYKTEVKKLL